MATDSAEALEGAIRVAAPLTYAQEDSVFLPDSHFLKLPSFEGILGKISRNVNPYPPDEHIVRWQRAQAPRFAQRDEGDKSSIPAGLFALSLYLFFFSRKTWRMAFPRSRVSI